MFMAAWNCCALATYDLRKIGENDLGDAKLDWLAAVAIDPGPELAAIMAKKLNAPVRANDGTIAQPPAV